MKLTVLLLAVAAVGCGRPKLIPMKLESPSSNVTFTPGKTVTCETKDGLTYRCFEFSPQHEAEVYAALWARVKKKHMKYEISCYTDVGCGGYAWDGGREFPGLDKSPGIPYYEVHIGAPPDPTATAELLLKVMLGEPNEKTEGWHSYSRSTKGFDTGEVKP